MVSQTRLIGTSEWFGVTKKKNNKFIGGCVIVPTCTEQQQNRTEQNIVYCYHCSKSLVPVFGDVLRCNVPSSEKFKTEVPTLNRVPTETIRVCTLHICILTYSIIPIYPYIATPLPLPINYIHMERFGNGSILFTLGYLYVICQCHAMPYHIPTINGRFGRVYMLIQTIFFFVFFVFCT